MAGASEDVMSLFRELLEKERELADLYAKIGRDIKNPDVSLIIESIRKDEERHAQNARKMIEISGK